MKFWSTEEDQALMRLYNEVPNFRRWKNITVELEKLGIHKSQYQCRERYVNKLDPEVNNSDWANDQVTKIFSLYGEYGSQWSLIQKSLPGRTQNSIKNKFYCTIRNFLRTLLKVEKQVTGQVLFQMSSKKLTDLYDGKKEFRKFKGFVRRFLKAMSYRIQQDKVEEMIQNDREKAQGLCNLIFDSKNQSKKQVTEKNPKSLESRSGFTKYVPEKDDPMNDLEKESEVKNNENSILKLDGESKGIKKEFPTLFNCSESLISSGNEMAEESEFHHFSPPLDQQFQYQLRRSTSNFAPARTDLTEEEMRSINFLSVMMFGKLSWPVITEGFNGTGTQ